MILFEVTFKKLSNVFFFEETIYVVAHTLMECEHLALEQFYEKRYSGTWSIVQYKVVSETVVVSKQIEIVKETKNDYTRRQQNN